MKHTAMVLLQYHKDPSKIEALFRCLNQEHNNLSKRSDANQKQYSRPSLTSQQVISVKQISLSLYNHFNSACVCLLTWSDPKYWRRPVEIICYQTYNYHWMNTQSSKASKCRTGWWSGGLSCNSFKVKKR